MSGFNEIVTKLDNSHIISAHIMISCVLYLEPIGEYSCNSGTFANGQIKNWVNFN